MALKHETEVEAEFTKAYIMNCNDMDEDYKKILVNLIDTSTMATNGITPEEKIQKITECIQKLAISQIGLLKSIKNTIVQTLNEQNKGIDQKIIDAITVANKKQCESCKAMKHANDVEKEKERKQIIDDFIKTSGINLDTTNHEKETDIIIKPENILDDKKTININDIFETVKEILIKPYVWIFGSILVFSPYGFNILKLLVDTFVNK